MAKRRQEPVRVLGRRRPRRAGQTAPGLDHDRESRHRMPIVALHGKAHATARSAERANPASLPRSSEFLTAHQKSVTLPERAAHLQDMTGQTSSYRSPGSRDGPRRGLAPPACTRLRAFSTHEENDRSVRRNDRRIDEKSLQGPHHQPQPPTSATRTYNGAGPTVSTSGWRIPENSSAGGPVEPVRVMWRSLSPRPGPGRRRSL